MTATNAIFERTGEDGTLVFLPFSVTTEQGELRMFLNVQKIARVVEFESLSPLPDIMPPFTGVYDMDGIPVPVVDLSAYFVKAPVPGQGKTPVRALPQTRRLLICNTMGIYVGLIVDRTRKIRRQRNAEVMPPPMVLTQEHNVFCAVIRDGEGFSYMLDPESLLEREGVKLERPNAFETNDKAPLKGKKILFVDDSKYFQSLGSKLLKKFAADVDTAGDGKEALERLLANPGVYDLVLTDIEMPVMSGVALARAIRHDHGLDVPIVFHSAISNTALIGDLETEGLGDYIIKFDERHLIEKVVQCLQLK